MSGIGTAGAQAGAGAAGQAGSGRGGFGLGALGAGLGMYTTPRVLESNGLWGQLAGTLGLPTFQNMRYPGMWWGPAEKSGYEFADLTQALRVPAKFTGGLADPILKVAGKLAPWLGRKIDQAGGLNIEALNALTLGGYGPGAGGGLTGAFQQMAGLPGMMQDIYPLMQNQGQIQPSAPRPTINYAGNNLQFNTVTGQWEKD